MTPRVHVVVVLSLLAASVAVSTTVDDLSPSSSSLSSSLSSRERRVGVTDPVDLAALTVLRDSIPSFPLDWPLESEDPCTSWSSYYEQAIVCERTHPNWRVVELHLPLFGLDGDVPAVIGELHELRVLDLSSNAFTGSLPVEWSRLVNLRSISVFNNSIDGVIPAEYGEVNGTVSGWASVRSVYLSANDLSGELPASLGSLVNLTVFSVQYNRLNGTLPSTYLANPSLRALYVGSNNLRGPLQSFLPSLRLLSVWNNTFTQTLPTCEQSSSSADEACALEFFYAQYNLFIGPLDPAALEHLQSLRVLYLRNNIFQGAFPGIRLDSLQFLHAADNFFDGRIRPGLGRSVALEYLNLEDNLLTGEIPAELGALTRLKGDGFSLQGNMLFGDLPPEICSILRAENLTRADLSHNMLTGDLLALSCTATETPGRVIDLRQNRWRCPLPDWCNLAEVSGIGNGLCVPCATQQLANLTAAHYFFSDFHGQLEPYSTVRDESDDDVGGVSALAAWLAAERANAGANGRATPVLQSTVTAGNQFGRGSQLAALSNDVATSLLMDEFVDASALNVGDDFVFPALDHTVDMLLAQLQRTRHATTQLRHEPVTGGMIMGIQIYFDTRCSQPFGALLTVPSGECTFVPQTGECIVATIAQGEARDGVRFSTGCNHDCSMCNHENVNATKFQCVPGVATSDQFGGAIAFSWAEPAVFRHAFPDSSLYARDSLDDDASNDSAYADFVLIEQGGAPRKNFEVVHSALAQPLALQTREDPLLGTVVIGHELADTSLYPANLGCTGESVLEQTMEKMRERKVSEEDGGDFDCVLMAAEYVGATNETSSPAQWARLRVFDAQIGYLTPYCDDATCARCVDPATATDALPRRIQNGACVVNATAHVYAASPSTNEDLRVVDAIFSWPQADARANPATNNSIAVAYIQIDPVSLHGDRLARPGDVDRGGRYGALESAADIDVADGAEPAYISRAIASMAAARAAGADIIVGLVNAGVYPKGQNPALNAAEEADNNDATGENDSIDTIVGDAADPFDPSAFEGELLEVASMLTGFDLLLGGGSGASHNFATDAHHRINGAAVVQTKSRGRAYSVIETRVEVGENGYAVVNAIDIRFGTPWVSGDRRPDSVPPVDAVDSLYSMLVDEYVPASMDDALALGLNTLANNRTVLSTRESALGNHVANALRWFGAGYRNRIGVVHAGAIAAAMPSSYAVANATLVPRRPETCTHCPPWDLVVGDAYLVLPDDDVVIEKTVSGETVWSMLEHSVSDEVAVDADRAFLQVSGVRFEFDSSAASGERVQAVWLEELIHSDPTRGPAVPNSPNATYSLALPSSLNAGVFGYSMLNDGFGYRSLPTVKALIDYCQAQKWLAPKIHKRIVDVSVEEMAEPTPEPPNGANV